MGSCQVVFLAEKPKGDDYHIYGRAVIVFLCIGLVKRDLAAENPASRPCPGIGRREARFSKLDVLTD